MIAILAAAIAQASPAPIRPPPPVIITPVPSGREKVDVLAKLSPAGRAIIDAEMQAEQLRTRLYLVKLRAAREAMEAAAKNRPVDIGQVREAMAERDRVEIERVHENSSNALNLLERLSPQDRQIVAGIVGGMMFSPPRAFIRPAIPQNAK